MLDAEQRQILADHHHHRRHRAGAEQGQPFTFGRGGIFVAKLFGQRLAHRHQIIARIEPLGNFTDSLAQSVNLPLDFPLPVMIVAAIVLIMIAILSGLLSLGVLKQSQPADLLR